MEKTVTADLGSQNSNDGGGNGSSLLATTILHPMVQNLAFAATNKAQNRVLKHAAAFNATIHTASTQQSTVYPLIDLYIRLPEEGGRSGSPDLQ
jgi:hypothetical protein